MFVIGALRILQLLFSVIVLGLSVTLIKGQLGAAPSQTSFAAFCGGWGVLVAFIGFATIFITSLQGIICAALDGITAVLTLIGGIVFAATLKINSCSDVFYIESNVIIRGAGEDSDSILYNGSANLPSRCRMAQAITAFLFFAFVAFVGTAGLGLAGRNGRSSKNAFV